MKSKRSNPTKLLSIFVLAVIASSLVSCAVKTEDAIIGRWIIVESGEKIEFLSDGTVTMAQGDIIFSGKYTFVDKEKIKIELSGIGALAGPLVFTVSISGDELTLTMLNGNLSKYKREK